MKKGPGLGARLEARFRPAHYWGAEFLAHTVRLCAVGEKAGKKDGEAVASITFEGTYAEAEAFAHSHGLAFEGLRGAVSHLPFKIEALEPSAEGDEDIQPQIDRARPPGLPAEALDAQPFHFGEDRFLLLCREDALRAFLEKLPPHLGALWGVEVPHLALIPFLDPTRALGHWAAILCEADFTHVLYFRETSPIAYAKVFTGWEEARRDTPAFATEMKKALVYHFGSRFPGAALEAIQIWRDGPAGETSSALKGLGIPQFSPDWGPLAALPEAFRVAGAMAYRAMRDQEPLVSFSVPAPAAAESRRLWRRRTGVLARTGYLALAAAGIGVAMLALSALGMHWTVASKARLWSGELQRWSEFQKQKAAVEGQLNGMKGLIAHRTDGYAGMQRIAALLPPEVWLENWELENTSGRRFNHRLEGYSLVESRIPEFLSGLEKAGGFSSVKLKSTERIKAETVEEKTKIQANRKDLVRFQIGVAQ